jgi:hypothetical protein
MTVAVHFAATAPTESMPEIARAFEKLKPLLAKSGAHERSELLINHPERKVQFLVYFASFEESHAFLKKHGDALMDPFRDMVDNVAGPFFLALEGEIGE